MYMKKSVVYENSESHYDIIKPSYFTRKLKNFILFNKNLI